MRSDYVSTLAPQFRILSDDQLEDIHLASLEVLRRTGVRVFDDEALTLLGDAGCLISDGKLVQFPANVLEDALASAPKRLVLCDRDGQAHMRLDDHNVYYGTGSDLPNIIDPYTGERRKSSIKDVGDAARIVDYLSNLDFAMSMGLPLDVPTLTSDRHNFRAMVENTKKPIVFTAWDLQGTKDIVSMAEAVVGSPEKLAMAPFIMQYNEPSSPLQHSTDAVQKLLFMASKNLPVIYASGLMMGATAPVSVTAGLVLSNAEQLSALAIAQLKRKGMPFLWGGGCLPLDMSTMVLSYSGPEHMLFCAGMADLAHHYYKLPVWGFAGCSDSKLPDMQAGAESTLWILISALSGNNVVHDVGYLESGLTCSYEMMVFSDEMVSMVKQFMGGIKVDDETLGVDLLDAVGPGGSHLETDHTLQNFRKFWYPSLLDRRNFDDWVAAGKQSMSDRLRERVQSILESYHPEPLKASVQERLAAIVRDADEKTREYA